MVFIFRISRFKLLKKNLKNCLLKFEPIMDGTCLLNVILGTKY
jgi:hypothetical protein